MKTLIKGSRIELIPEEEIDRDRLAQIPEGSNEVFVYTTLDGGDEGNQEAVVIHIGPIDDTGPCDNLEDEPPTPARAPDAKSLDGKFHRDLEAARDKLYEALPTGTVDAFELLKVVQAHIAEMDKILEAS